MAEFQINEQRREAAERHLELLAQNVEMKDRLIRSNEVLREHIERIEGKIDENVRTLSAVLRNDEKLLAFLERNSLTVDSALRSIRTAVGTLVRNESNCPCYPFLVREKIKLNPKSLREVKKITGHYTNYRNLFKENWRLYFLDPIQPWRIAETNKNDATGEAEGYKIGLPREWVKQHKETLRTASLMVQFLIGAAKIANGLTVRLGTIEGRTLEGADLDGFIQIAEDFRDLLEPISQAAEDAGDGLACESFKQASGESYRVLLNWITSKEGGNDPTLERVGLKRAVYRGESVAWVLEEHVALYEDQGERCLHHVQADSRIAIPKDRDGQHHLS